MVKLRMCTLMWITNFLNYVFVATYSLSELQIFFAVAQVHARQEKTAVHRMAESGQGAQVHDYQRERKKKVGFSVGGSDRNDAGDHFYLRV